MPLRRQPTPHPSSDLNRSCGEDDNEEHEEDIKEVQQTTTPQEVGLEAMDSEESSSSSEEEGEGSSSSGSESDEYPQNAALQRSLVISIMNRSPREFFNLMKVYMDFEFDDSKTINNQWISRLHVDWCELCITLASKKCRTRALARFHAMSEFRVLFRVLYRRMPILDFGKDLSYWMINRRPEESRLFDMDQQESPHSH